MDESAVTLEHDRISGLRDGLRVEEIIVGIQWIFAQGNARTLKQRTLLIVGALIARASACLVQLQKKSHYLALDFAELDRRRCLAVADTHPYKALLPYFDAADFGNFEDYPDWTECNDMVSLDTDINSGMPDIDEGYDRASIAVGSESDASI
jgi:hypothetical protein